MKCEKCSKNPATYHLTAIENGQKKETHLCEECARNAGMGFKFNTSIADLLGGKDKTKRKPEGKKGEPACPRCGLTFSQFRQSGRFGCENDYEFFGQEIPKILEKIHGKDHHVGKVPKNQAEKESEEERIMREKAKVDDEREKAKAALAALKGELEKAVKGEEYEKAAQIRDQIRKMEAELAAK